MRSRDCQAELILSLILLDRMYQAIAQPLADFGEHRQACERCRAACATGGAFPLCRVGLELAVTVAEVAVASPPRSLLARIVARLRR